MAVADASDSYFEELFANAWLKAFAISLALHLALLAAYRAIDRPEFKEKASRFFPSIQLTALEKRLADQHDKTEREIQMIFVNVDPALSAEAPPPETRFYAAVDSVAANPSVTTESALPKIETAPPPAPKPAVTPQKAEPLQPALPLEAESPPETASAQAPANTVKLAAEVAPATAPPLAAQEGGVQRRSLVQSFDAKASPFGAYDAAFIARVQKEWDDLLAGRPTAANGKVKVEFLLTHDGRIMNLEVVESDVDDFLTMLCRKAIQDPAPYPRWPVPMRQQMRDAPRFINITFEYYHP
jgi:outer membrane biosynthesis protein TonB